MSTCGNQFELLTLNLIILLFLYLKYLIIFSLFQEQLRKNSKIIDLLSTDEGVLALCIVQEFLEFCELKYTHTVLESEIGVPSDQIKTRGRQQLISDLKLNSENSKTPVLCQLLGVNQQTSAHQSSNSNNKQVRQKKKSI